MDRGVATAKALRRGVASGFPAVIYCRMAFTLRKDNNGWGNQKWQFSSYVILDEWYDFAEYPSDLRPVPQNAGARSGAGHRTIFF